MWLVHAYGWLTGHNLWQSVVGWFVFSLLTAAATWFPWRKHKKVQAKIADRLDTSTPGGLTDLVEAVNRSLEQGDSNAGNR